MSAKQYGWIMIPALAVLACFVMPVSADEPNADTNALNVMCPVLPDMEANPKFTIVYKGKKIAFCCDRCITQFKADPEKYLHRLPQFASMTGEAQAGESDEHEEPAAAPPPPSQGASDRPSWFGRIHPIIVHLPVAGIPLALLGFLIASGTGKASWANTDKPPLLAGALGAVAAFFTGHIAEESAPGGDVMIHLVEQHETAATIAMICCVVLAALRLWKWRELAGGWRWAYGVGLVVATGLLAVTGYLGGSIVFGPGHLAL